MRAALQQGLLGPVLDLVSPYTTAFSPIRQLTLTEMGEAP